MEPPVGRYRPTLANTADTAWRRFTVAPPAGTLRVGRYFLSLLAVLVVLYGLVFFPGARHTPRLGLDLEGGTQLVLRARTVDGNAPSTPSLNEARKIINERVNGKGVAEAEVVTQGSDRIVVSIPGSDTDVTDVGSTAQLNFRPLCYLPFQNTGQIAAPADSSASAAPSGSASATGSAAPGTSAASDSASPSPSPSTSVSNTDPGCSAAVATFTQEGVSASATPTPTTSPSGSASTSTTPSASGTPSTSATPTTSGTPTTSATQTGGATPSATPTPSASITDPTTLYPGATRPEEAAALAKLDCAADTSVLDSQDKDDQVIVACSNDGAFKYVLGRVIVKGTEIDTATVSAPDGTNSLQWAVNLDLKSSGQRKWADWTAAHNSTVTNGSDSVAANYVAFVLDGKVLSAPHTNGAITGTTQVSGSFNQTTATDLADSLKYGALPITFTTERSGTVSATLGTAQLKAGLLAGGIGLALVVLYSLLYYRALGIVTILSLGVSAAITYASLVVLGREMGFTLTLAGIAGFIVAVGITADSFVVFFERLKDEVHEGRTIRVAVPRAWNRARRTILSADTVSLLAAVILYYFAADQVRGFAFTLGLSTLIDLLVVFVFTHPLVSLLSRSKTFTSAKVSGLSAARIGGVAVSEARSSTPRRSGSSQPTTSAAGRATPRRGGSATAVLEREDELEDLDADDLDRADLDAFEDDLADAPAAIDRAGPAGAVEPGEPADTDPPAVRTDKAPRASASDDASGSATGTAAERAAARRA
ncbi:MAG: secD, partial [Jatrophihabitantaceae bacterium]|nr:secD [Jatrophihabitantaceae bacterium]